MRETLPALDGDTARRSSDNEEERFSVIPWLTATISALSISSRQSGCCSLSVRMSALPSRVGQCGAIANGWSTRVLNWSSAHLMISGLARIAQTE